MISILLGLALVAVIGGATAKHIRQNPTSARRLRAAARKRSGSTSATSAVVRGVKWTWRRARTRKDRLLAKRREVFAEAKKRGATARTAGNRLRVVAKERRPVREVLAEVKENLGLGRAPQDPERPDDPPAEQPAAPAEQPAAAEPKPRSTQERGTPVPETSNPTPSASAPSPSITALFEVTERMDRLPFESLMQVKQFTSYLGMGCDSIARMYVALSQRMAGPMSIDRIITEPVERCGAHQRAVQGAIADAETYLTTLLNSTPRELLARGITLPKAAFLNGQPTALGRELVPMFYESASGLATRPVADLRDIHVLLKALGEASAGQWRLYRRVAGRLTELRVAGCADFYYTAARQQGAVTSALADADTAMGRLLTMTLRELATSGIRAPEMQLSGL